MKNKFFITGLCATMMLILASCGSALSYDKYELDEYIEVGEYKNLKVAPYSVSVTDDELQAKIQSELEKSKTTEELNDKTPIEEGDTVNIDYVGKKDGKAFDGGTAEGYDLEIGSETFIDGFEDGLIGKKVGEKVKLNLTFPKDYDASELAGADVVFEVTINSAVREAIPEYNLDFVQNTTDYATVEEYESALEKQIYDEEEENAILDQKTELWSQALENTKVKKYPEKELEHYIDFNSKQIDEMADAYGMSREDLLESYDFGDEEEFAAVNEDSSRLRVKQEMLIEYIAAAEGLSYTEKEKEAMIADFEATGYDEESIKSQTGRNIDEYAHIELLYQKVLDFLLENANITGAPEK